MHLNPNQYEINLQYQRDLHREAQQSYLANLGSTSDSGVNLITVARNSVGNLLTNFGDMLQDRYRESPVTSSVTGTFAQVEA